ncbi:hypothetical protein DPMN_164457 [Dreissena polymorpha]|uniref:Uncharacterized protein n=1 Tax=Dreissena polymorpha TaxID=45954 RepID=A0A9D4ITR4_DREPO|nr:hypothetical protein DPMN_164457 [Dreissena polymorpha]
MLLYSLVFIPIQQSICLGTQRFRPEIVFNMLHVYLQAVHWPRGPTLRLFSTCYMSTYKLSTTCYMSTYKLSTTCYMSTYKLSTTCYMSTYKLSTTCYMSTYKLSTGKPGAGVGMEADGMLSCTGRCESESALGRIRLKKSRHVHEECIQPWTCIHRAC